MGKSRKLRVAWCAVGLWMVGALLIARGAWAVDAKFDAELSWDAVNGATGFKIYVGYDADQLGAPIDVGGPTPDSSGVVHSVVTDITVGPTSNFAVSAYVADGSESLLSNHLSLTYAEVAPVVDSDADGIADGDEDRDMDRTRDPNETDPLRADTDGDGVSDGAEVQAGTDPLDASSYPGCGDSCNAAIWLGATTSVEHYSGAMSADATYAGGADLDPAADALTYLQLFANSTENSRGGSGDEAHYDIEIPVAGEWYLWGRFYYPSAPTKYYGNSFFARIDDGARLKFGNNRDHHRVWHWDGDGYVEYGGPVALRLGVLSAGHHALIIEKREVTPIPPRLDLLMLTSDPAYVPTDADAIAAHAPGVPGCGSDEECDDGVFCTLDRCEPETRDCTNTPFDAFCDDHDVCNGAEACDAAADCVNGEPLHCDDGSICNGTETCDPTQGCRPGSPPNCDDGVACTADACVEAATPCKHSPNDASCADADQCTKDRCGASGCEHAPYDGACDDGLSCTANDACTSGVCSGQDTCARGFVCDAQRTACTAVPGDPDHDGLRDAYDPCPLDARNLCAGTVAIDRSTDTPIRLNAYVGSAGCQGAKVDCNGDAWAADFGYEERGNGLVCGQGNASAQCTVQGVEDLFGCTSKVTQDLLRCAHGAEHRDDQVRYDFDVARGRYVVTLLFTSIAGEGDDTATVDVVIEDKKVSDNLDLVMKSGEANQAIVRAYVVDVDDDGLRIKVQPESTRAVLNAIEVLAVAP